MIGRGGPQEIFDAQLDVSELLRAQSATEWVIISTGMFMSYLFEPEFGVVAPYVMRRNPAPASANSSCQ